MHSHPTQLPTPGGRKAPEQSAVRVAVPILLTVLASILGTAVSLAGVTAAVPQDPAGPTPAAAPPRPEAVVLGTGEAMVAATDSGGEVPRDLSAADFAVTEGGEPRTVLGVELPEALGGSQAAVGPWQLTVFFDAELSDELTVSRVGRALSEHAAELAAAGWVEVVIADPEPRLVLPATRDPEAVAGALGRVFVLERGHDRLVELRREAQERLAATPPDADRQAVLAEAVAAETALVGERLDTLLAWLADRPRSGPRSGPRALLLVSDGYDLDPAAALRDRLVGDSGGGAVYPQPGPPALAAPTDDLGRALAAYGWTVVPLALRFGAGDGGSRWGATVQETPEGEPSVLGTYRLPRRKSAAQRAEEQVAAERAAAEPPEPLPRDPLAAFERLAAASGGEVVTDPQRLDPLLAGLSRRVRVRWSAERPAGAEPRRLEVTALRAGLEVGAPRWVGWSTPEAVSALRARRLLDGEPEPAALAVTAMIATEGAAVGGSGRLEARVTAEPGAVSGGEGAEGALRPAAADAPPEGDPRVTVAALGPGGETVVHRRVPAEPLPGGGWRLGMPVELPAGVERVAVVVEDLGTGRWGGGLAGLLAAPAGGDGEGPAATAEAAAGARWDADLGLLPAPRVVNLLAPEARMLRGEVRLETVVSDPAVARVEFRLDGRRAATADRPPFAAALDLGSLPFRRRVEAIAFDARGAELGRDELVLNEGGRGFAVRIEGLEPDRAGAVDVAVSVSHPEGDRLDRVELWLNQRRVATLFSPPWRYRLPVGSEAAGGYVRATAVLADGSTAEDVRFLDGSGHGSRIEVNLVELYVVVSDRDGRPVRDLAQGDFEVFEDGGRRELAGFGDAGDLPVTVGLAIDSSASMFFKLPKVQAAAARFLDGLQPGRDHAFLVDFDTLPRLAAEPTADLARVADAVGGLDAGGQTSLWEAIVYSLVQLQGVHGRKALVVYSDGADEDKGFRYRTCLRFARKLGIPIYVIVSNNEAVRTDWLGIRSLGDRVARLTDSVGGRTYLVRTGQDLGAVYREIEDELRSQYLLTFYSQRDADTPGWREVRVEVHGRGLTARTVSGHEL